MNIKEKLEALKTEIRKHDYLYYVQDRPSISDYDYDKLISELKNIEREHPELITPDSPTQRVGGTPLEEFTQVPHRNPMLSLDNTYDEDELREFDKRIRKTLNEQPTYVCELKIDGIGISLVYEDSKLVQGVTRGDGAVGEDVTNNIRAIKSIPLVLETKIPKLEVRGEVYMKHSVFRALNKQKEEEGESLHANPRNAAAGAVRLLDPRVSAERQLDAFLYTLNYIEGRDVETQWAALNTMSSLGFKVNPHSQLFLTIEEVIDFCKEWIEKRDSVDYDIDGIVVKVSSFEQQATLGFTGRSPRWATAYKFPARRAISKIESITIQVGRTGSLTPVAELTPTQLAGSLISRALLHNAAEIARKDIHIGDKVLIERAGDVIPAVVEVLKDQRTGDEIVFKMPDKCPECNGEVYKEEDEAVLRCMNPSCPAQLRERVWHFASKEGMDIENLGSSTAEQLVSRGLVKDISDIYYLREQDLYNLEGFGVRSAKKLIEAVEKSKSNDLPKLLFALGIRHVGKGTSEILTEQFKSVDRISQVTVDELSSIPEIGTIVASSIVQYFKQESNLVILNRLKEAEVNMKSLKEEVTEGVLIGKTFVLTGALSMTRDAASDLIKRAGGRIASSVSKNTDYVVVGEEPGSKYDKAVKLGITLLDEEGLMELLGR